MQPLLSLLPKNKKFVPQADWADVQHSIRPASQARAKAAFVFTVRKERREGSQDRVVAGLYHITELCSSNHHKVLRLDPITAPVLQSPCEKCHLTPRWPSSPTTCLHPNQSTKGYVCPLGSQKCLRIETHQKMS